MVVLFPHSPLPMGIRYVYYYRLFDQWLDNFGVILDTNIVMFLTHRKIFVHMYAFQTHIDIRQSDHSNEL